jgi:hypothetical protein
MEGKMLRPCALCSDRGDNKRHKKQCCLARQTSTKIRLDKFHNPSNKRRRSCSALEQSVVKLRGRSRRLAVPASKMTHQGPSTQISDTAVYVLRAQSSSLTHSRECRLDRQFLLTTSSGCGFEKPSSIRREQAAMQPPSVIVSRKAKQQQRCNYLTHIRQFAFALLSP